MIHKDIIIEQGEEVFYIGKSHYKYSDEHWHDLITIGSSFKLLHASASNLMVIEIDGERYTVHRRYFITKDMMRKQNINKILYPHK